MIRVAFVGCGGIQQVHCRHLSKMEGVTIVGHCDVEEARAKAAAERYGGEACTDYLTMYSAVKPDAVYVTVPPYAHGDIEEAAAQRGIHLFIEKPIALDKDTAKRVARAIARSDIMCSVAYCFRYYDTAVQARKLLKGQAVCLVSGFWTGGMPEVWWWRRMDKSGGQIVEQTTHIIDLARYWCGEVAEVYAIASTGSMTKVKDFDVYDSSVVTLRMKTGATATITSTCVADYNGRVALDVLTPEGWFTFSGGRLTVREAGKTTEYESRVDIFLEENKAFIEAVRTGKRNRIRSSYADACRTFLVTCAANESIRSGLPVRL